MLKIIETHDFLGKPLWEIMFNQIQGIKKYNAKKINYNNEKFKLF